MNLCLSCERANAGRSAPPPASASRDTH
jgi:hypothetical protein